MILKGTLFNNFLKEYTCIYEICSFELEFISPDHSDCQIIAQLTDGKEIYIPIELEDYEKLANELYENNRLDLTKYNYAIYKAE